MYLVDQMLKNDDEPIAVSDLVSLTKEPREHVLNALFSMSTKGLLTRPSGISWEEVDAFTVGKFRIETLMAVREKDEDEDGQGRLDWNDAKRIPAPQLSPYAQRMENRRSLERPETVTHAGWEYRAAVYSAAAEGSSDGHTHWAICIEKREAGAAEWTACQDDPTPFVTDREAWTYWDETFLRGLGYEHTDREPGDGETAYRGMYPVIRAALEAPREWSEDTESYIVKLTPETVGLVRLERVLSKAGDSDSPFWLDSEDEPDKSVTFWLLNETTLVSVKVVLVSDPDGLDLTGSVASGEADEPAGTLAGEPTLYDIAAELEPRADGKIPLLPEAYEAFVREAYEGFEFAETEIATDLAAGECAMGGKVFVSDPEGQALTKGGDAS
jgi:hypothetical protein